MKIITSCITIFSLSISSSSLAQFNFSAGPQVNLEITQPYEVMDINCVPDSARAITINWELIEIESSIPPEWDLTICDVICYPFFPTSGSGVSYTTADWDTSTYILKLGVSHNNVNGSGSLTYYLFDENDPTYGDTLVFNLNFQSADLGESSLPENFTLLSTSSGLLLTTSNSPRNIQLFTSMGQLVFNQRISGHEQIDDLAHGLYFIVIDNQWVQRIAINSNLNK